MTTTLTPTERQALVDVATRAVAWAVDTGDHWQPDPHQYSPALQAPGAAFVTLRRHGRLRGCIGRLVAVEPLVTCVADRARAAALDDPRFPPVSPAELPSLEIEVSILDEPQPLDVSSYEELLTTARPGVDGLTVESPGHRATLLPAVWDDVPTVAEFVDALWRKAGLRPGSWPHGIHVSHYTAQTATAD